MARFADGLQRDLEAADQSVNWSIEHHPLQQNGEAPWEPQASHERHEIIIHIPDKEGHRSGITPTTSWHSHDHEQMASPVEILDNGFNKEDGFQVGKISQINHEECAICLSDFDSESDTIALDCKHLFHKHCINCWLYKGSPPYTCPACRDPLRQGGRTPPVPEHCPEGLPETPVMLREISWDSFWLSLFWLFF
ncbi:hypothetical protein PtA15_12A139 [Puccinia triticina]|uniref:RING-type domain-containing protein n=1 Tax=Puccinia triticina TaxID=208348 RepID=A0ABY7CZ20_9BASI|nr:uncharacterized protein PtA15_12A139 [Puccinia triticina]WAQ90153.1 hypothetical protein PtA15_12A139 [Puccinia triticina]